MFKVLFDDSYAPIKLLHPMTEEHSILRRSLVPSLLDIVKYNNARKNYNLSVYEISLQYGLTENEKRGFLGRFLFYGDDLFKKAKVTQNKENQIIMDYDTPLSYFDGKTAYEVSKSSYENLLENTSTKSWAGC